MQDSETAIRRNNTFCPVKNDIKTSLITIRKCLTIIPYHQQSVNIKNKKKYLLIFLGWRQPDSFCDQRSFFFDNLPRFFLTSVKKYARMVDGKDQDSRGHP
jgi:hypothetical protein